MRQVERLSDLKIKHLPIPAEGTNGKKYYDGHGLYLHIFPNGSKSWRYSYNYFGKGKIYTIGLYPVITLKEARERHLEARRLLSRGIDPSEEKQRLKREKKAEVLGRVGNSFAELFFNWYQVNLPSWTNEKYQWQVKNNFEHYVLPYIGNLPVNEISPMQIADLLQQMGDTETMSRTKWRIKSVFDFAITNGKCTYNPAASLPKNKKKRLIHLPALPIELLPKFFVKLEDYPNRTLQLATKLLILTWLRNTELRLGKWSEIHGNEWIVPAERMKMKREHIVPLSDFALEVLDELKSLSNCEWIITDRRNRPISNSTLSNMMQRMGYKDIATPHGFRAMASTVCNESGLFNSKAIESQLSHKNPNAIEETYDRAEYQKKKKKMMQWYSDLIRTKYLEAKGEL